MPITSIDLIPNPHLKKMKPIKEKQDILIPDIVNPNISRRNGMVYCLTGSGGSGKSSLLLNMFKDKSMYKGKFHNIYLFTPSSSFNSVEKHPFENHDKVYHELTIDLLENIYQDLVSLKKDSTEKKEKKERVYESDESESESDEEKEVEYSCIILDDFADALGTPGIQKYLNKFIIKLRHLCCSLIITLQSYYYLPKILRKQITYVTMFKTKNTEEFNSIAGELMNVNKNDALILFNYVFNKPYTHLDIDLVSHTYYKNFNLLKINS